MPCMVPKICLQNNNPKKFKISNCQKISISKDLLQNQDSPKKFFIILVSKYPLHSKDASLAFKIFFLVLPNPNEKLWPRFHFGRFAF